MTAEEFETLDEAQAVALLSLRFRTLASVGIDPSEAALIAGRVDVPLADLVDLVRRGFTAEEVLRLVGTRAARQQQQRMRPAVLPLARPA